MATEIGALSHLVEAATALANLDCRSAKPTKKAVDAPVAESIPLDAKPSINNTLETAPRGKREIFPQRLLAVLNDESLSDIISWLPHGKSFVIIRPDVFTEKVMPTYFPPVDARGSTKYPSFTRKLNRWYVDRSFKYTYGNCALSLSHFNVFNFRGFRQATRGPDTGAFHHPLFRRDQPELCVDMVCQRSRGSSNTSVAKNQSQSSLSTSRKPVRSDSPVKVAPLTKESIDKILPSPRTGFVQTVATVSVDETRSVTSNNSSSSQAMAQPVVNTVPNVIKRGISSDKEFVDLTIRQRDEMERMRIAHALLYKAFTSALQEQTK